MDTTSGVSLCPTFIEKYKPHFFRDFHFSHPSLPSSPPFTDLLRCLLSLDRVHILFLGAPESCKTTFLFAVLREYYELPSADASLPERNIMYINGLKEQGINYYRNEMKIFCQSYGTVPGKKKVVVVDDLDTINDQCQQVFRSYLDKYGHNFHFIGVCTNVQNVVESVQSRLQFVRLPSIEKHHLAHTLDIVAEKENLQLCPRVREFLLQLTGLTFRPLLNYLQKIKLILARNSPTKDADAPRITIDFDFCENVCADIHPQTFVDYLDAARRGNKLAATRILFSVFAQGYSVLDILDFLFAFAKNTPLLQENEKYHMIPLLCKYITIFHTIHEDKIELAFFTNQFVHQITHGHDPLTT